MGNPGSFVVNGRRGWWYDTSITNTGRIYKDSMEQQSWSHFVDLNGETFRVQGPTTDIGLHFHGFKYHDGTRNVQAPPALVLARIVRVEREAPGTADFTRETTYGLDDPALYKRVTREFSKLGRRGGSFDKKPSRWLRRMIKRHPGVRSYWMQNS